MAGKKLPGEFELIERYFAPLAAGAEGAYGLLNDAARVELEVGSDLIVTKDLMVAGVHFPPEADAGLVARKLLRINLSDLAAMGADPIGYLIGLALPRATEPAWLEAFVGGLAEDQERFGFSLLGGDTVATEGPLILSLTALGSRKKGQELTRAGAKPGDLICVSGTVGDGALGLKALKGELAGLEAEALESLIGRYRLPEPRLDLGRKLCGLATAALDVSDGLVADLGHICEASGMGARIEAEEVPLSPPAQAALALERGLLSTVLTGGDDYELLFTLAAGALEAAQAAGRECGVPVRPIGRIEAERGVRVVDAKGAPVRFESPGYRHF